MRALAATGERAEALRAWERCRAEVVEELGVEPSAETEAVYLQLLDAEAPEAAAVDGGLPSGVVTFLLTDIVGSSTLWERDRAAMDRGARAPRRPDRRGRRRPRRDPPEVEARG